MSEQNDALDKAITQLMEPLVRILLKHGKSYNEFAQVVRYSYADTANREFPIKGKRQTVSRVAVLTGLHRKDVRRLLESSPESLFTGLRPRYNRLERVIQGWLTDAEFTTPSGEAKPLVLGTPDTGFEALVKRYSGDMPARAVLDELTHSGTAVVTKEQGIELVKDHYQPAVCDIPTLERHTAIVCKHLLAMEAELKQAENEGSA